VGSDEMRIYLKLLLVILSTPECSGGVRRIPETFAKTSASGMLSEAKHDTS